MYISFQPSRVITMRISLGGGRLNTIIILDLVNQNAFISMPQSDWLNDILDVPLMSLSNVIDIATLKVHLL